MEPNFRGQYEHKMLTYPCPIPCLGKSALCIQPSYRDHTMLHVSLIHSLFSFGFSDSRYTLSDPVFAKFSIVCHLGRTPKCHCFQQQYGNSLSWHMIKREIISFLLAGSNPDKYRSRYVSVHNQSTATVRSSYRGKKCGVSLFQHGYFKAD